MTGRWPEMSDAPRHCEVCGQVLKRRLRAVGLFDTESGAPLVERQLVCPRRMGGWAWFSSRHCLFVYSELWGGGWGERR